MENSNDNQDKSNDCSNDGPILPPLPSQKDRDRAALRKAMERGTRGQPDWRPWYFDMLVEFKADPTQTQAMSTWCKEQGLDQTTATNYINSHPEVFWPAVDISRKKYHSKVRDAVWNAILSNIKKSFNDRKLALQLIGDFVEKTENTTTIRTPEEKRAYANELLARLGKIPAQSKNTVKESE